MFEVFSRKHALSAGKFITCNTRKSCNRNKHNDKGKMPRSNKSCSRQLVKKPEPIRRDMKVTRDTSSKLSRVNGLLRNNLPGIWSKLLRMSNRRHCVMHNVSSTNLKTNQFAPKHKPKPSTSSSSFLKTRSNMHYSRKTERTCRESSEGLPG